MFKGIYCMELNNSSTSESPEFDIVFVHGLSSSAESAWKNELNDLWPLWIKQFFPNCRVLLLNYPADTLFFSPSSRVNIKERSSGLADFLPTIGIGVRPTIYICHSLGGILVKEIIRSSVRTPSLVSIASNSSGVVFLATPHSGSDVASFAKIFGSSLTKDLSTNSEYLLDLKGWFSNYITDTSMRISSYYETKKYKKVLVVTKESANPACYGCTPVPVDENHSTICKPNSINNDVFIRIKRDIQETIKGVNDMTKSISSIDEITALPEITNQMYFDIIHFLNRTFFTEANGQCACIISNPSTGKQPCCIIVTQKASIQKMVMPLVLRWPDRFRLHSGYLGEFVSSGKSDLTKYNMDNQLSQSISTVVAKIIAELLVQIFQPTIETTICSYWEDSSEYKALTAAHNIQSYIKRWCEEQLKKVFDKKPKRTSKIVTEIWRELNNVIDVEDNSLLDKSYQNILNETVNECFKKNMLTIIMKNVSTTKSENQIKSSEPKIQCRLLHIDYEKDIAVLVFPKPKSHNKSFKTWEINNSNLKISSSNLKTKKLNIGDKCTSPALPKSTLLVKDINKNALFPFSDRITQITNIIVLSGAEPKHGDSGSPILNESGNVVGMIIGKANYLKGEHTLAVSISSRDIRQISKNRALSWKNE